MNKGLKFGNYYLANSIIHHLDPRVKFIATLLFLVELFIFNNFHCYIILTIFLILVIRMSKIPLKMFFCGAKAIIFIIVFTSMFNMFVIEGNTLVKIGIFRITDNGLNTALFISVRLLYIYISSSILMYTTTSNNLTDGMTKLLEPLKRVHIPIHELSMITSITLRFIPVLSEEAAKIMKAQTARGVNFKQKRITKRIKNYIPVLIPLFVSSFRRSNDLAMAMAVRGYRGDNNRSKMKPLRYQKNDFAAYMVLLFLLLILVVI